MSILSKVACRTAAAYVPILFLRREVCFGGAKAEDAVTSGIGGRRRAQYSPLPWPSRLDRTVKSS